MLGGSGCSQRPAVRGRRVRRYGLSKDDRILRHRTEPVATVRLDELQTAGRRRGSDEGAANRKSYLVVEDIALNLLCKIYILKKNFI